MLQLLQINEGGNMTSKLDWTVHDIHLTLLKVKADGEKALEELD